MEQRGEEQQAVARKKSGLTKQMRARRPFFFSPLSLSLPALTSLRNLFFFLKKKLFSQKQAQSDNSFSSYDNMSAAATRDAAAMSSGEHGRGKKSDSAAVAVSDPTQDAVFVRGAIANALPQLLPGARNADVTVRAEVPGVVERPEAVPGKPLAVADSNKIDASSNKKPAPEKKDGIFYQDVTTPSTAPLILANQDGDPSGPKPPPPKPASASIASDNAVAETAKRTAGDASADVVRAEGAAALPVLTSEKEAKLEAAFDKFFDKLTSPQTQEMVQRASKGALNGALVAAASSSSSAAAAAGSNDQNALASVVERGGSLPAGNEADATSPGGVGGNAGFLGIPLSDVKRVARSSSSSNSRRSRRTRHMTCPGIGKWQLAPQAHSACFSTTRRVRSCT